MSTVSKEDYLRVIYKNLEDGILVNASLIAEQLQISNAAVSEMLRKLSNEKYLSYVPYRGIQLLQKGKIEAVKLVRRHRIWETFLYEVIKVPWYKIDEEAENLEHSSSDDLIDRLEGFMNNPEFDPHGHPIPRKNGFVPKQKKLVKLSEFKVNKSGFVRKVNDQSSELLHHLFEIGLTIGKKFSVIEKRNFDNSMVIEIENRNHTVSEKLAQNVFAEILR